MMFKIVRSSDSFIDRENVPNDEFESLEELMDFQESVKYPLIITPGQIEIYDDWRE